LKTAFLCAAVEITFCLQTNYTPFMQEIKHYFEYLFKIFARQLAKVFSLPHIRQNIVFFVFDFNKTTTPISSHSEIRVPILQCAW
jgi:hypothetical protein